MGVSKGNLPEYVTIKVNFKKELVIKIKNIPDSKHEVKKIRPVSAE